MKRILVLVCALATSFAMAAPASCFDFERQAACERESACRWQLNTQYPEGGICVWKACGDYDNAVDCQAAGCRWVVSHIPFTPGGGCYPNTD